MGYISAMQLFVNGEPKDCPVATTLAQFIEHMGMKGDRVAVERNREIVPRAQWPETQLQDGDRLEIVHFVGGGTNSQPRSEPQVFVYGN
jgi:sulfur carrier protein